MDRFEHHVHFDFFYKTKKHESYLGKGKDNIVSGYFRESVVHLSSQVTKLQNLGKKYASEASSTEKVRSQKLVQRGKLFCHIVQQGKRFCHKTRNYEEWRFCVPHNRASREIVNVS